MNQPELRQPLVLANEFKEGDQLVGGTRDECVRQEARQALSALRLRDMTKSALVDDGVSEALARSLNQPLAAEISHLSVAELKPIL